MDDTDLKLSDAERAEAWELLRSVADSGTTVLAVCSQAPGGAITVRTDNSATTATESVSDTADVTEADATDASEPAGAPEATTTEKTTDEGTADAFAETGRA